MEITSTYIESLDKILGGGVIHPSTILIAGTAGTGRTTLGIQSLCGAAKQGENVLYVAVTPKSADDVRKMLSSFDFFEESIRIHTFDISMAERDPLTMLVELGNIVASTKPDRILIDPVTPLGFGFPQAERRRFMYSLSSAIQEWKAVVYLTGVLKMEEIHGSVISDIVDSILYLSQETTSFKKVRKVEIIKMSGQSYMEGKHNFEITGRGITFYPTIIPEKIPSREITSRVKTNIPELDQMLGGGMVELSATLIAGSSGTGKTTTGLHYIIEGAQNGEPGVIISFEEVPQELYRFARGFGWELEELEKKNMLRIIYTAPSEVYPSKHAYSVKEAIEEIGAKRVLVDSVAGFDYALEKEAERREHIHNLIRLFKSMGLTSLFTSEMRDITGNVSISDIPASFLMDSVILLRHVEIQSEMKKALLILKMRGSSHDSSLREYEITDHGIKLGKRFSEYTEILTGTAKERPSMAYEPYISGFTPDMEKVMRALIGIKEASITELAEYTGMEEEQVRKITSSLAELGYVIKTMRDGAERYKVVLTGIEKTEVDN